MRLVHSSIDMSLENNARTNAGTYRHVNQPRLIPSRSPAGFTQSGGIGIILHCDGHAMENDADAAALGEAGWGSGRNKSRLIYVTVGTGIGAGIILEGHVYR